MHHVAIMNRSWKLIPKILSGEKTIESRWYKTKRIPWNSVKNGDTIFFKDSGDLVTLQATVGRVIQIEDYTQQQLRFILKKYGGSPGICFSKPRLAYAWAKDKNYAILIFLKDPRPVKPFQITKAGFGSGCAWITVKNIKEIII